jgi:hypothetical protein
VEPNQVRFVALAVPGDLQKIIHALEPRFTGEIVRHVRDVNRRDRIHDDVPVVHSVTTAHLDMRTRPDANAAPDSAAADSLAKAFGEHHGGELQSLAVELKELAMPTLATRPPNIERSNARSPYTIARRSRENA